MLFYHFSVAIVMFFCRGSIKTISIFVVTKNC